MNSPAGREGAEGAPTDGGSAAGRPGDPAGAQSRTSGPTVPNRQVQILDLPQHRVRRPADLVNLLGSALGVAVVLILSEFAYSTTAGVTQDVQSALAQAVRSLLLVPVTVIEGLLALVLPIVVIVTQVLRRNLRGVAEALVASAAAFGLAALAIVLVQQFAEGTDIARSVTRWRAGEVIITITPTVAALSGLLTAVGTRAQRRVVAISWNLLLFAIGISIITGDGTLVGALVAVLLGRIAGLAMRYGSGVHSSRAYGEQLVNAITSTGVDPLAVVRVGDTTQDTTLQPQTATVPGTQPEQLDLPAVLSTEPSNRITQLPLAASATVATERPGENRVYAVLGHHGARWDAVVLDGDRQVIGLLSSVWSALRLRGLERRAVVSLKQAAERAALMYYAATAAGVNSPKLHGIAEANDSVVLVGQHIGDARTLGAMRDEEITEQVMVNAWEQLVIAHGAGLAHRNLSADTVLVGTVSGEVWLNGWEQGEVAASPLAQRVDLVQLLTCFALATSVSHAMAAASRVLSAEKLAEIAPLLQPVALPSRTRAAARADRTVLTGLREALLGFIPGDVEVEAIRLTRFSARTVVMLTVAVVAIWVVLTTLNFAQVRSVMATADPVWMIAAFALGLISYLGAAIGLMAFCPERLGLWRTTLVQVASSALTLVVPAGMAPAALSVRFMQKNGVRTSLAVATAALQQLTQFVSTVLLVAALALFLRTAGPLQQLPSLVVVITLAVVAAVTASIFLIAPVRTWVLRWVLPTLRQVWPRVVWLLGRPKRLAVGMVGALMVTGGFLAAFMAVLHSIGQDLPLTTLTIVYLTGNTVGSAVPTPGGMGAVELALSAGLRTVGLATAAAASAAILFRVLTFWVRIPLGWLAWRYLQRRNAL